MKKIKITDRERKRYILKDEDDFVILEKIKLVEKNRLSKSDKEFIKLIRTQLEDDWRIPLIKYLDKLLRKYKK